MIYLVGQILVCLVLAGMLGVCVGWLLRGTGAESRENRLESSWRLMIRQRETEVAEMRTAAQRTRAALIASERRHKAVLSSKEDEIGRLKTGDDPEISAESGEAEMLRAQVEELTARLETSLPQDSVREAWANMRRVLEAKDKEIERLRLFSGQAASSRAASPPGAAVPVSPESVSNRGSDRDPNPDSDLHVDSGSADDEKDDLKTIYGIGPATERKLNKLGFRSFRDLATLSVDDIARIAEALDCQPDRIERDDWVSNARTAHEKKYGEVI